MKTTLTIEQSEHLIKLGIDYHKSSAYSNSNIHNYPLKKPLFAIVNLLDLLPKCITKCNAYLNMVGHPDEWWVGYENEIITLVGFASIEFIDALYELLCWVIENGYYQPTPNSTEE